uniref:Three-finger toxin D.L n=1 Tax=Micrurus diastema TaxID=39023 RepID=A0A0H4BLZ2_9SAUR|nr:three-finger toxin precursor D.L [Micrurus diastema]
MKTLLLTLVVVTIVCLDLGYTRKCYEGKVARKSVTCPKGENLCFTIFSFQFHPARAIEFGCAASCPKVGLGPHVTCCSANNCNSRNFKLKVLAFTSKW